MKSIKLINSDLETIVDDDDFPFFSRLPLEVHRGYAAFNRCYIHRLICPSKIKGLHVHHKNKNKLDNRKENLELLTEKEHKKVHVDLRSYKLCYIPTEKELRAFAATLNADELKYSKCPLQSLNL